MQHPVGEGFFPRGEKKMFVPAHEWMGEGGRVAFVLHGLLGSRSNWRGFGRRLARTHPEWGFVLVDLRHHGDSHGAPAPDTVAACAADLAELGAQVGAPEVVIGHSFGGKVALAYARDHGDTLRTVWSLDSPPGPADEGAREVEGVIAAIRALAVPVARREDAVAHFVALGFSRGVAGWMTTNLRPTEAGFVWRFALDRVEALLADYRALDLWPFVRAAPQEARILRAGRSDRWSAADAARATDVLPDAGHWVHVDDPEGLAAALAPTFRTAAP